eukprot:2294126-Lingulodinium_polyedra.AAC.1
MRASGSGEDGVQATVVPRRRSDRAVLSGTGRISRKSEGCYRKASPRFAAVCGCPRRCQGRSGQR